MQNSVKYRKSKKMLEIEEKFGVPVDELLRKLYLSMNLTDISNYFNDAGIIVSTPTLSQWLYKLKIPTVTSKKIFTA